MWSRFMAFLATVIFIATGCILILVPEGYFITQDEIFYFINRVYTNFSMHFICTSIGLGILALGVFNIYLFLLSLRRKSFVNIRGPQGDIQIAYRSIEELVQKITSDIGGIDKISTRIIPKRKKISLVIRLFLGDVNNVIDISYRIQERVKEEVQDVLGITNLGQVKILVKRIAIGKRRREEDILEKKRISRGIELNR